MQHYPSLMGSSRRVLLLACSATKRPDAGVLPAADRYDGPMFRSYRAGLAQLAESHRPAAYVLSAEHGLIPVGQPIANYERRLDAERADELAGDAGQIMRLGAIVAGADELYIAGGALYRSAVLRMLDALRSRGLLPAGLEIVAPAGLGIGEQRAALKKWLVATIAEPSGMVSGYLLKPRRELADVLRLRGCHHHEADHAAFHPQRI